MSYLVIDHIIGMYCSVLFFFSSRRRHTRCSRDWSSDVCSSDLTDNALATLRFRLASVPMEAAEDSFEADGLQFNAGTFILRNVDRAQLEKAASGLGLHIHSTNAALNVAAHPISAPRVGIVHNWQNTQNDGWFRIAFDELKIPYTYGADTWLRENSNLREKFD